MIEKILKFSLRYPIPVILLTLCAAFYGFYSFSQLPIDAVPDITTNQVQINTSIPGFSPVQVEKQVTYIIETALAGIPGLQMTRSLTRNGFSQVTAIFDDDVNIYFARQQISERLNEIKDNLPEGSDSKMGPISTGLGEIYMWTIDYQHPEGKGAEIHQGQSGWQYNGYYLTPEKQLLKTDIEKASYLRTVQDWIVKPQLKGIKGLAGIDSIGGYVRQYHVEPDLDRMMALGLRFEDITNSLHKNNMSIGPGYIENGGESFLIKADERMESLKELENVVITNRDGIPIRIKDIAQVVIGKEMRSGSATEDGHEAVIGTAMMLIGANSRTVAQAVDDKFKEINQTLPPDIHAKAVLNRTKLVNATIHTVVKNLSEGAVLVIAILFLFLGQFRAAFVTALIIPLSMLLTITGMAKSHISGNLMSLGAIDFGLIVDGAVIITENCLRRLVHKQKEIGRPLDLTERLQEVLVASKEMIQPTVFGQAIIITVYIPILTLSGVEGKMFHPMAMTVIIALVAAFVLSLTFVPASIALFVKGNLKESENTIVSTIKKGYEPILKKVLAYPVIPIFAGVALVIFSFLLFTTLGEEFVPTLDEKDIAMHAIRIPSTSLTQSTQMQTVVEETIKQFPQVSYVFSKTGTAEMASDPMPPNVSDTFLILKPIEEWPNPNLTKADLIEEIEKALRQLPGNNYEFTQPIEMRFNELISGVRSDVAVKIYGDDFDLMQHTAESAAAVLQKIPGSADVKVAQTEGLPVLDVKINRDTASQLGLNVADGLQALSMAVGGAKAGQIFEGDRSFDIFVKLSEKNRQDPEELAKLPVPIYHNDKREFISLGHIAKLSVAEGLNEIMRENGKRFVSVQANVRGRDLGSYVEEAKRRIQKEVVIPKGYWINWGGQFENLVSARERLIIVVPVCLSLIFLLLYAAFHSFTETQLVFSGVPMALSGGIWALWLRDLPFSISAAVGFIALSGIAVLNGLVLISYIDQLIQENYDVDEAICKGALTRLRPVLMTALVASLGFIPMALATGTGAEVQKPLATVVIGGLMSSTLLTLIVLPALYKIFSSSVKELKVVKVLDEKR